MGRSRLLSFLTTRGSGCALSVLTIVDVLFSSHCFGLMRLLDQDACLYQTICVCVYIYLCVSVLFKLGKIILETSPDLDSPNSVCAADENPSTMVKDGGLCLCVFFLRGQGVFLFLSQKGCITGLFCFHNVLSRLPSCREGWGRPRNDS